MRREAIIQKLSSTINEICLIIVNQKSTNIRLVPDYNAPLT